MIKKILTWTLIFSTTFCSFAQSFASAEAPHFYADVVNIDITKSGRVFVTVTFTGKDSLKRKYSEGADPFVQFGYPPTGPVAFGRRNSSPEDCKRSATLMDSQGNEYLTNRCQTQLVRLQYNTKSSFVYEFSTPYAKGNGESTTYSLIIPLIWSTGLLDGSSGETSLSFFKVISSF